MASTIIAPRAAFVRRWGIQSKDGTKRALAVPPKSHPLARRFAAAAISRAKSLVASGAYDEAAVIRQVRKANVVLYGKPAPSAADKATTRKQRLERDLSYFSEARESTSRAVEATVVAGAEEDALPTPVREALRVAREANPKAVAARVSVVAPILEAQTADDGSIPVMVLSVGPGNPTAKNYYDDDFVKSLADLIPGADSYWDHPSLSDEKDIPERRMRDKCGWWSDPTIGAFADPREANAKTTTAVYAKFHPVVGDPQVANILRTCQEKMTKYPEKDPFAAFSINAYGIGAPGEHPDTGESGNIMSQATHLNSIDMVTQAGARGRPMMESNRMAKTPKKKGTGSQVRLSRPYDGGDLDIRTPEEKALANAGLLREAQRAALRDLLAGPLGEKAREAAGIAADVDVTDAEALDDTALEAAAVKVGLSKSGILFETLKKNLVVHTSAAAGDESDGDEVDESDELEESDDDDDGDVEGDELEEALTPKQILSMTGEEAKKALMKRAKKAPTKESGGGKSPRERALDRREAKIAEAEREVKALEHSTLVRKVATQFKFPEPHIVMFESRCSGATSQDAIVRLARAYNEAYLAHESVAGNDGRGRSTRESAGRGGAKISPGFTK